MRKTYKKIVAMFLVFSVFFCFLPVAHAADVTSPNQLQPSQTFLSTSEQEKISSYLENLPVFITFIDCDDQKNRMTIQDEVSKVLSTAVENRIESEEMSARANVSASDDLEFSKGLIKLTNSDYTILELSASEKNSLLLDPICVNTLRRVYHLIEKGTIVESINLYRNHAAIDITSTNTRASDEDLNSDAYWESNLDYMGRYNGYKFLYSEDSIMFRTSIVTPGGIYDDIKWTDLIWDALKTSAKYMIDDTITPNYVGLLTTVLSEFFDSISPLTVTYGDASGSEVLTWLKGNLYTRDIFVSDNLDRIPGYAYYNWGSTQQLKMQQALEVTYPISIRSQASNTYNYRSQVGYSVIRTKSCNGFYGNTTIYQAILNIYTNYSGLAVYEEKLDVYDAIHTIIQGS